MSSTIYTGIPTNYYESGFLFSFAPNVTPQISGINNVLIIGQANSLVSHNFVSGIVGGPSLGNAVVAPDTLTVATTYGLNSVISKMYTAYRAADPTTTVYLLPLADPGGQPDSNVYSITGGNATFTASQAGTLNAYVAGTLVQCSVNAGDSAANVVSNLSAAINANYYLPCVAQPLSQSGQPTAQIQLTATGCGLVASDVDFRLSYLGPTAGEITPPGFAIQFLQSNTFGGDDPDPTPYLANLPPIEFDAIISPYTSGNSMSAYNTLLNQNSGRWSYIQQLFGFVFTAKKDTFANLVAFGQSQNTQFVSCLGLTNTPTTVYEMAAAYGGACVASLAESVATPLQAISLNILAPAVGDRYTPAEGNTLLQNGIALANIGAGNEVILNRAVTMYRYNNQGILDTSYQDTTVLFTLQYVIETFKANLSQQFARVRLVDDATPIPQGSNFVSTKTIEASAIAIYAGLNTDGYVSDVSTFAQNVLAQSAGGGRVNLYCPIVLASPLVQLGVRFQFSLT